MEDNPIIKFRNAVTDKKMKAFDFIKKVTGRLTQKQALVLVIILFSAFVLVDIIYIVRGFSGNGGELKIEHLKQPEYNQLKSNDNETGQGTDSGFATGGDDGVDAGSTTGQ